MIKQFLLSTLRLYQRYVGSYTNACRFSPTCSEYMYQAISRHGILSGLCRGILRILRCHPWNKGGYDPLPNA